LTDARLVLGHLPPDGLAGGTVPLDRARAGEALGTLAAQLGVSLECAAADVIAVADVQVARAVRRISVERGHDPATLTLLPFGGAGALHACAVARELQMREVLVPPAPGLLCAYGALIADVRHDFVLAIRRILGAVAPADGFSQDFVPLLRAAEAALDRERIPLPERALRRACALRYRGQSFELLLPAEGDLVERFSAAHRARYGYNLEQPVELVSLRVRALGRRASAEAPREGGDGADPRLRSAPLFLEAQWMDAPHLARRRLETGVTVRGPALIAEYSATTLVEPGWSAEVLPSGSLRLRA
jgi:N-methylhydantoinase A